MSQEQLAEAADISVSTIKDFESERRMPIAKSISAIERVFVARGIEPIDESFIGLKVRRAKSE